MTRPAQPTESPRQPSATTGLAGWCVLAYLILLIATTTPGIAQDAAAERARVLQPTLGRPAFVAPGGQLVVRAVAAADGGRVTVALSSSDARPIALSLPPNAAASLSDGKPIVCTVPTDTPSRTYDLVLSAGRVRIRAAHCVAVTRADDHVRIVHLSNMNLGSLDAPRLDPRLISEINLVAPTAIIMTGDLLDATRPDPRAGWDALVALVRRFDAPVIIACGDHDDMTLYSTYAAPSPIGQVAIGRHRCIVLYDQPYAPLDRDRDQIRWVENTLARPGFDGVTIIATHDDYPTLLAIWQRRGQLANMLRSGRVGLWLCGGHRDWDGVENAALIRAAAPMRYVRTHESSSATRGGASGIPHYAAIDLDGDRVNILGDSAEAGDVPASIELGHLHATVDGPNDGSNTRVGFEAISSLPFALTRLAQTVRVRKSGPRQPWCRGATIEQTVDRGAYWELRLRFDLPDKSALRGLVGTDTPPATPAVVVNFNVAPTLLLHARQTPDGLTYQALEGPAPRVTLRNDGQSPARVAPLIRLDGQPIAYRPAGDDGPFVEQAPLTLAPGARHDLQLDFSAIRVSPGRRTLLVYVRRSPVLVPSSRPLLIREVR